MYESTKLNTHTARTPVNCVPNVVSGFEMELPLFQKYPQTYEQGLHLLHHQYVLILKT
jgi:hypothetical protein